MIMIIYLLNGNKETKCVIGNLETALDSVVPEAQIIDWELIV